jgi:hypothetical protein
MKETVSSHLRSFANSWRRGSSPSSAAQPDFGEAHITPAPGSCHMKNRKGSDLSPRIKATYLALHPTTIEKIIVDCVMDLKVVIALDGIEITPNKGGFRVLSHDFHGPLPDILIEDSGDTFQDKDRLGNEACKLIAIVRLRDRISRCLPGGEFLPPTTVETRKIVGFKVGPKTLLAEGDDFLAAYDILHEKVVG